jgi:hypothetical protein
MTTRAEVYRARATECAAIAATSADNKTRTTYAELAIQWRITATKAEAIERQEAGEDVIRSDLSTYRH